MNSQKSSRGQKPKYFLGRLEYRGKADSTQKTNDTKKAEVPKMTKCSLMVAHEGRWPKTALIQSQAVPKRRQEVVIYIGSQSSAWLHVSYVFTLHFA